MGSCPSLTAAAAETAVGWVAWPSLYDLPDDVHLVVQLFRHLDPPCNAGVIPCQVPIQFLHRLSISAHFPMNAPSYAAVFLFRQFVSFSEPILLSSDEVVVSSCQFPFLFPQFIDLFREFVFCSYSVMSFSDSFLLCSD
jgi:hypothetical protein